MTRPKADSPTEDLIMNTVSSFRRALGVAALALGASQCAHAFPWTSTGSGGTPDEAALASDTLPGKISLSGPYVTLLNAPASSSATIRYNVTAVFDRSYVFTPSLEVRFQDSSANTRVLSVLKSYDTTNGAVQTLAQLDSNSFAASSLYQIQRSCSTNNLPINEFGRYVYWVEVTLSRSAATGLASLAALRIDECVW